jgi:hypothetical protein
MLIDIRPNYQLNTKFLWDHEGIAFQVERDRIPRFLFRGKETAVQVDCERWSPHLDIYTLKDPPVGHWDQVRLLEIHSQTGAPLFSTMAMVYDGELFIELGKAWVSLFSVEELPTSASSNRFQML